MCSHCALDLTLHCFLPPVPALQFTPEEQTKVLAGAAPKKKSSTMGWLAKVRIVEADVEVGCGCPVWVTGVRGGTSLAARPPVWL